MHCATMQTIDIERAEMHTLHSLLKENATMHRMLRRFMLKIRSICLIFKQMPFWSEHGLCNG